MLWSLGGLSDIRLGESTLNAGSIGTLLGIVGIVWLTNLYNFMDGIDGVAAGEAASVAVFAGALLWATGAKGLAATAWIIAAAAAGFLLWNWSPARIFMGDVGSGFLGFLFGALAVASEATGALPGIIWLLLLGVFIVDATATLLRRMVLGHCWYCAHRQHAYQRAVQAGLSHRQVSGFVLALNLFLGGAAVIAVLWTEGQPLILLISYCVLLLLYAAVERVNPMTTEPRAATPGPNPQKDS